VNTCADKSAGNFHSAPPVKSNTFIRILRWPFERVAIGAVGLIGHGMRRIGFEVRILGLQFLSFVDYLVKKSLLFAFLITLFLTALRLSLVFNGAVEGASSNIGNLGLSYINKVLAVMPSVVLVLLPVFAVFQFVKYVKRRRAVKKVRLAMNGLLEDDSAGLFSLARGVSGLNTSDQGMADEIMSTMVQLSERDRARRELIADVSHDLLKPVALIQAYLETIQMKQDELSADELSDYMETMRRNTHSLDRLVSEFLELSKLDAAGAQIAWEPFSVSDLVHDIYLKFLPHAKQKGIELLYTPYPKLSRVMGDLPLIERALSNLLDNALRFTPKGSQVYIGTYPHNQKISVQVQDTGIGIPEAELGNVFEPLFQAHTSESREKEGHGLGLAIVKKIVDAHHSQIYIKSAVGEGTAIAFELELAK